MVVKHEMLAANQQLCSVAAARQPGADAAGRCCKAGDAGGSCLCSRIMRPWPWA